MKPKPADLEFEPNQAFEKLRKFGRIILSVSSKEIENGRKKLRKSRKVIKPLAAKS